MADKLPEIKEKTVINPIISHIAKIAKNNFYDYSDIDNDKNEIFIDKYVIDTYLNIFEIIHLNLIPDCKIISVNTINKKENINRLIAKYHEHIIYWDYTDDYSKKIEETTHFNTLNLKSKRGSIAWHLHSVVMEGIVDTNPDSKLFSKPESNKMTIFVSV
jgi:hypothetical protein